MSKPSPRGRIKPNSPQVLYRFWNREQLLYIGISQSHLSRMDQHEATKFWYPKVTNITLEHYPDRASVEAAEKAAIKREQPLHNVIHNQRRQAAALRHFHNLEWALIKKSFAFANHAPLFDAYQKQVPQSKGKLSREFYAWAIIRAYKEAESLGFICSECNRMVDWPEVKVWANAIDKQLTERASK